MTKRQRYLSYLLRMWQISDGKETVWRASLQSPNSEERHGFANLEELSDFLKGQAEQPKDARIKSGRRILHNDTIESHISCMKTRGGYKDETQTHTCLCFIDPGAGHPELWLSQQD